jgi:hypothetical protein
MFHLENMNTTKQLRVTLDVSSRKHEYNETTQSNIGCFMKHPMLL